MVALNLPLDEEGCVFESVQLIFEILIHILPPSKEFSYAGQKPIPETV